MNRVLAIHHEEWKLYLLRAASRQKHRNLGTFEDAIREAGLACDYHESATGQPLQRPLEDYSHVVVLGGNMGAYEEEKHAFLRDEMRILEQALAMGLPVLGICLGSQLLARIHGARVYPGEVGPELGWNLLELTADGRAEPALAAFPTAAPIFQWHYDTFDLPSGAVHLARSARYEHQGFRVGDRVWGLQFHLEADERLVRSWLRSYARDAESLAAAREATALHLDTQTAGARTFIRVFLGQSAAS